MWSFRIRAEFDKADHYGRSLRVSWVHGSRAKLPSMSVRAKPEGIPLNLAAKTAGHLIRLPRRFSPSLLNMVPRRERGDPGLLRGRRTGHTLPQFENESNNPPDETNSEPIFKMERMRADAAGSCVGNEAP